MIHHTTTYLLIPTLLLTTLVLPTQATAQGTLDDYTRAYGLYDKFKPSQVYNNPTDIKWDTTNVFHYAAYTPNGLTYYICTTDNPTPQPVDMKALTQILETETGQRPDSISPTLKNISVEGTDITNLHFEYAGYNWEIANPCINPTIHNKQPLPKKGPQAKPRHWMEVDDERGAAPVPSPDGELIAYIKNDNVYVANPDGTNERALSNDGTTGNYYSSLLQWSPDGKNICANKIKPAPETRYVYYVESAPETQLQPILHKQEYPKPGDELRFKKPCIFNVETGKALLPTTTLFSNQYDLYGPQWSPDGKAVFFEYNERGHKVYRVLKMNAQTGDVSTIVEETSETFVNYSRTFRQLISGGRQLIWMSERDNWNHLYLIDTETASTKQITKGEWVVREVIYVDTLHNEIFFTASGINTDEDPYFIHYYKIGIDGKGLVCLTPEPANHHAVFNNDYTMLIDTYSTVDTAPTTVLRTADGNDDTRTLIAQADLTNLKAAGWSAPEVFTAVGRDGKTPLWGIIQRPTNFDPQKTYPVIEYIYSGPGDAYTPKSFISYNHNTTALAELGFIVIQLDGMGTSYRGKKFEDVCYKNLKDAGFPDRKLWIRAACEQHPYMDSTRVGIFGASAGGQEAMAAVLFHPDLYKAAYASCGCHDNRMDKIWWNEQWMSYPIDSSYIECSNVENAWRLTRPLMLVVGELDDNVDPASTMQVADALIKANKDFELVVLPGTSHTMGGTYGEHKRFDFFVKNIMGITPPRWDEVKRATDKH